MILNRQPFKKGQARTLAARFFQQRVVLQKIQHFYCLNPNTGSLINLTSSDIQQILIEVASNLKKTNNTALVYLELEYNRVGELGCIHSSMTNLIKLCQLNLENNQIGEKGCKHLSKSSWNNMSTLNLRGNMITEKGCVYLSKLSKGHAYSCLNFSYENMSQLEIQLVSEAVKSSKKYTVLSVQVTTNTQLKI